MKKILLLLSFGILSSCDWGATVDYIHWNVYQYENQSGYDMRMDIYSGVKSKSVIIPQGKVYKDSIEQSMGDSSGINVILADSIKVMYDSIKMKKYYLYSDDPTNKIRNPILVDDGYVVIKQEERKTVKRFTFTPDDYNNATPCNGNCE